MTAISGHKGYFSDTDAAWGAGAPTKPWPDAHAAPLPMLRESVVGKSRLAVGEIFRGKHILLIGTTGFVGKVALSMLLHRYPDVGRVYCLVRPGAGNTADERFYKKVAVSEVFDPLRETYGDGYLDFLKSKIVAIPGDIGRPLCNFSDEQISELHIDVIINSAGLVSFAPSLESALRINAMGAKNVLDLARKLGARLCHVSTCYVAGQREGDVWEDEPVVGYFPRSQAVGRDDRSGSTAADLLDRDFDPAAEIADCLRIIEHARERSNDRQLVSEFRERGARALRDQRRDPDNENDLKIAVARERKVWMNEVLTKLGMERARHWGWTNTYTYTKSLGEQVILSDRAVISTIVRPAVVESSVRFPFPGWNEGFNTTAPLMYLLLKGHRNIPMGEDTALDVIPVDFVASGMLLATAAVLAGEHEPIYQLGASDVNRVSSKRLTELTALAVRRYHKVKAERGEDRLRSLVRARLEGRSVTYEHFERYSAPMIKKFADSLIQVIDHHLPRWGAPRIEAIAERARDELTKVSTFTGQINELVELFKPFTTDHDIAFRCDHIRALWARVSLADQDKLLWAPHLIDWRAYWLDTHFPGLQKWTFDKLDEEFGAKPKSVYTYKELIELFEATVKLHRNRTAMRLLSKAHEGASRAAISYTFGQVHELARQGAAVLRHHGVAGGERVMLMSENRPEWGISYFAMMLVGATCVPLDSQLTLAEVVNLAGVSRAPAMVLSRAVAERLAEEAGLVEVSGGDAAQGGVDLVQTWSPAHPALQSYFESRDLHLRVLAFDELLAESDVVFVDPQAPIAASHGAARSEVKGDSVASLIFTSGTTGTPKGVMLTHKNFTSMASKLSSLFTLYKHDRLLSVLPLHHTFEFATGFLMPLIHGASITYLEQIDADSLARALEDEGITGMIGVPALWQLLERKIYKNVSDAGTLAERGFESVLDFHRLVRDALPWDASLGKALFFPVHRKLGGRLRLLISGGSALPPETMKTFHGLGFNLYEGYGMTESAPVLTVTRPGDKVIPGSVGRPLPGIDVKIHAPDARGIGEVIAKGPNVMAGYFENAAATSDTLIEGWLHTGDLGKFDADGNLYIVGRKKEMILGPSGENVYPDELEELYRGSEFIKEVSIVGLPGDGGHETVAALIVPDYGVGESNVRADHGDELSPSVPDRETIRDAVREHVRSVSKTLPLYKRVKVFHLWDRDLPKTSTRKVKRREVVAELQRLERAARLGSEARQPGGGEGGDRPTWIFDLVADVTQRKRGTIGSSTALSELGFDSLMFTELAAALEAAGVELPDVSELNGLGTVGDLESLVSRIGAKAKLDRPKKHKQQRDKAAKQAASEYQDDIAVPRPVVEIGRRALRRGMRELYERVLETDVYGGANVPPFGGYIVAANHSSHLDTGLVKYALGESGDVLVALGAKDYFFDDPVRRMYFENFTNVVPMARHGSLRESLRLAGDVIRDGYILLIFPEGTRSETGVMTEFKPSLGYLALQNKCGILPMYLYGTHDAMPKGRYVPKRGERVAAHVGPFVRYEDVARIASTGSMELRTPSTGVLRARAEPGLSMELRTPSTGVLRAPAEPGLSMELRTPSTGVLRAPAEPGLSRTQQYRAVTHHVESIIRRLAPRDAAWTLGDSGTSPIIEPARNSDGETEVSP